jgi:hypothetical protein
MPPRGNSPPAGSAVSGSSSSSSRSPAKRLLKELETWRREQAEEKGIERLGPVGEEDLFEWEAVINGKDIGFGYDGKLPPPSTHRPPLPFPGAYNSRSV